MSADHDFYQISLKILLKNQKGEILALNGLPNGVYANLYDFPGGRIRKKEFSTPIIPILRRELKEEVGNIKYKLSPKPVALGRHLLPTKFSKLKKDIHVLYLFFEARYIGGKIKIGKEHSGYKWIDFKKHGPKKIVSSGNLEGIKMYLSN